MAKRSKRERGPVKPAPPPPPTPGTEIPRAAPKVAILPRETPRVMPRAFDWKRLFQVLLIIGAVFWIYWPAVHGDWLWDDDYLIEHNDLIHDPEGLERAWFSPADLIDYFPLTVSLEWLEWQIWPDNTFCYHLSNIILHLCSALLVWRLLGKLGLRRAWLGGLLFAIHPVMVESVAWIAELKNTLSLPFFLLAVGAWIDYDRRRTLDYYFLALALFLVAMLCKTTMVMFPVIILLYAWWKRGRIGWNDLLASAPFFAISLALSLALISLLRYGVGQEFIPLGGFFSRMACAGLSLSFYFSKCFLPVNLLPIYPQWNIDPPSPAQFLPWLVLGGALYWLWSKRHEPWARHVLLGFGFFLINLAPFVGFRTISFMRFTWVMDHFLYLPIIGLIGLAVAAWGQVEERLGAPTRPYAVGGVVLVMALLTFGSHRYAKIFINSKTQWTYTIRHSPNAWPAYNDLGNVLFNAGQLPEAKVQYEEALRLNPNYPEAHNNLGIILAKSGRPAEAIEQFEEALKLCPALESAQENLAKVQARQKAGTQSK
jgi:Kef-type K+ transport system membrane component KefB